MSRLTHAASIHPSGKTSDAACLGPPPLLADRSDHRPGSNGHRPDADADGETEVKWVLGIYNIPLYIPPKKT